MTTLVLMLVRQDFAGSFGLRCAILNTLVGGGSLSGGSNSSVFLSRIGFTFAAL